MASYADETDHLRDDDLDQIDSAMSSPGGSTTSTANSPLRGGGSGSGSGSSSSGSGRRRGRKTVAKHDSVMTIVRIRPLQQQVPHSCITVDDTSHRIGVITEQEAHRTRNSGRMGTFVPERDSGGAGSGSPGSSTPSGGGFNFDAVLDADCDQSDVFELAGRPIIDGCLQGYNGTIFAYGQTGSGKTYTIQGSLKPQSQHQGLIPRMFKYLFTKIAAVQKKTPSHRFTLRLSMLQIYNDKLSDLLVDEYSSSSSSNGVYSSSDRSSYVQSTYESYRDRQDASSSSPSSSSNGGGGGGGDKPLKVRERTKDKTIYVEGLSEHRIGSLSSALKLVLRGIRNRKTDSTNMNEFSSRSHSFVIVNIESNPPNNLTTYSRLNLIDLAGSEDQRWGGNTSEQQFDEAVQINLSLTYLGSLLRDVVEDKDYCNYRNCSLTWLLRDSIGGNAKTCVISTISPEPLYRHESLSTLRFASQLKFVQNRAVRNLAAVGDYKVWKREVAAMSEQLKELQWQLQNVQKDHTLYKSKIRTQMQDKLRALEEGRDLATTAHAQEVETLRTKLKERQLTMTTQQDLLEKAKAWGLSKRQEIATLEDRLKTFDELVTTAEAMKQRLASQEQHIHLRDQQHGELTEYKEHIAKALQQEKEKTKRLEDMTPMLHQSWARQSELQSMVKKLSLQLEQQMKQSQQRETTLCHQIGTLRDELARHIASSSPTQAESLAISQPQMTIDSIREIDPTMSMSSAATAVRASLTPLHSHQSVFGFLDPELRTASSPIQKKQSTVESLSPALHRHQSRNRSDEDPTSIVSDSTLSGLFLHSLHGLHMQSRCYSEDEEAMRTLMNQSHDQSIQYRATSISNGKHMDGVATSLMLCIDRLVQQSQDCGNEWQGITRDYAGHIDNNCQRLVTTHTRAVQLESQMSMDTRTLVQEVHRLENECTASTQQCRRLQQVNITSQQHLRDLVHQYREVAMKWSEQRGLLQSQQFLQHRRYHMALCLLLQHQLDGAVRLVHCNRRCLRSATMGRIGSTGKRYRHKYYLFGDVLLYATVNVKALLQRNVVQYTLGRIIHLPLCRLTRGGDDDDDANDVNGANDDAARRKRRRVMNDVRHCFTIHSPQKDLHIVCSNEQQLLSWMNSLRQAIETSREPYLTIQAQMETSDHDDNRGGGKISWTGVVEGTTLDDGRVKLKSKAKMYLPLPCLYNHHAVDSSSSSSSSSLSATTTAARGGSSHDVDDWFRTPCDDTIAGSSSSTSSSLHLPPHCTICSLRLKAYGTQKGRGCPTCGRAVCARCSRHTHASSSLSGTATTTTATATAADGGKAQKVCDVCHGHLTGLYQRPVMANADDVMDVAAVDETSRMLEEVLAQDIEVLAPPVEDDTAAIADAGDVNAMMMMVPPIDVDDIAIGLGGGGGGGGGSASGANGGGPPTPSKFRQNFDKEQELGGEDYKRVDDQFDRTTATMVAMAGGGDSDDYADPLARVAPVTGMEGDGGDASFEVMPPPSARPHRTAQKQKLSAEMAQQQRLQALTSAEGNNQPSAVSIQKQHEHAHLKQQRIKALKARQAAGGGPAALRQPNPATGNLVPHYPGYTPVRPDTLATATPTVTLVAASMRAAEMRKVQEANGGEEQQHQHQHQHHQQQQKKAPVKRSLIPQ